MSTNTITLRDTITPRTEKWIRISAVMAMLIVATSSAVLSFDGLQKLALASRVPEHLAFLFPIAVDTTILMGSLAVLLYELVGVRSIFGWFTVLFGTVLSVTGNVISVNDAGIIAQVLHGIIPVLLCISLESLLRILRFNIQRTNKALADERMSEGTQISENPEPAPLSASPAPVAVVENSEVTSSLLPTPQEVRPEPIQKAAVLPVYKAPSSVAQEPKAESAVEATEPSISNETVTVHEPVAPVEIEVAPKPEDVEVPAENNADLPESEDSTEAPAEPETIVPKRDTEQSVEDKIEEPEVVVTTEENTTETPEPAVKEEEPTAPAKAPAKKPAAKRTPAKKPSTTSAKAPAKRTTARKPASEGVTKTAPVVIPENVEEYKKFLKTLPDGLDRQSMAREVRKQYPKATLADIKAAILS